MHHKLESTLKRSFRSIDLRYFVGYMFLDEISKEYSAIYGQLANVQEYIYRSTTIANGVNRLVACGVQHPIFRSEAQP